MNKRQQKKRLKKALDVLNEIEVFDSDLDGDGVIYMSSLITIKLIRKSLINFVD